MDLITADVTDLPRSPTPSTSSTSARRSTTLAAAAGTIGYEILTSLGARYDRVYKGSA